MKRSKKVLSRGRKERRTKELHPSDRGRLRRPPPPSASRRGNLLGGAAAIALTELALDVAPLLLGGAEPGPDAVCVELPSVAVVGKAALEHVQQLGPQSLVFDRGDQLHPTVEVARHQVRGTGQDPGLIAALEGVDPRV